MTDNCQLSIVNSQLSTLNSQLSTKRAGTGAPPLPINDRLSTINYQLLNVRNIFKNSRRFYYF
ncbi:MAG: hypothetical protein ACRC62_23235 [Microcoleus sp.]